MVIIIAREKDFFKFCFHSLSEKKGVNKGYDDIFAKDREALHALRTPPFYAMECGACINTVHGDIR